MRLWPLALVYALATPLVGCVEESPNAPPSEEDLQAAKEHILSAAPAKMRFPVGAELGGKLVYLGMDVDVDRVTPGQPFNLTHYWKVLEPVGEGWRLFVHLGVPGNKSEHRNADHVPVGGKYPVSYWKKGEIIRDIHRVSIPAGWRAPEVEIYTGIWKGAERLKVTKGPSDGENRIVVGRLPAAAAAPPAMKRLVARRVAPSAVKLDGKLDEPAWQQAVAAGPFVGTLDGAPAEQKTEAKVLWDDKNLYVAFSLEDSDVWSTFSKRDDKLWTQEAVEVFLDADGDGKTYVELQVNPRGTIFDSYLPAYRQNQNDYDAPVKVAVQVDGTVDQRDDRDRGWMVEMQIPFETARGKEKEMKNVPPQVGTSWRMNLFRMDLPAGKAQQASGWSPPLVGDFHALDKFGVLVFGDEQGETQAAAAPVAAPGHDKPAPAEGAGKTVAKTSDAKASEKKPATPRKGR